MPSGYLYVVIHGYAVAFILPWWVVGTPNKHAMTNHGVVMANGCTKFPGQAPPLAFTIVRPIDEEGDLWPCDETQHSRQRPWCQSCTQIWPTEQLVPKEEYETFRSTRRPEWGTGIVH